MNDYGNQPRNKPLTQSEMPQPIIDTGRSPSVGATSKRQFNTSADWQDPTLQEITRGHQVNYSFGQQPFKAESASPRQHDYNYSGSSTIRKIGVTSGQGTTRVNNNAQTSGQPQFTVMSSMPSNMSEQNSNQASSKVHKSAVSMTSVMGEQLQNPNAAALNNIFAQSIQASATQLKNPAPRPPVTANDAKKMRKDRKPPATAVMSQTQQNMMKETVQKVESVEQLVNDGLSKNADRESVHRVEAESMGLRKSQDGFYEQIQQAQTQTQQETALGLLPDQIVDRIAQNALNVVTQAASLAAREGKVVPDDIRNQMLQQGFRPSSKNDAQFEYDSDTVEKYEMISNEFDYDEIRQGNDFGIKQYKDCIYRGQLNQQRQREGVGVLVYMNGRVYEGEWLKNKRHGRGFEVFTNGNSYHGTYEDGKANGKGVYQWKNGEVYDGEWLKGIKHGYGVWKGTNGESYIGQWVNSKAQGYGVHVFANGDKYEGEWLQCLREGNGSDFFANGDCYVGQYSNGKPEGFGQYKWKNGSSYTGQFVNGLKHGHGKWKKKQADEYGQTQCNSYEGMYENDKKHGFGVFDWESGNQYQGNYLNDERHGYGVMRWTDESMYMGIWDQGIQHGVGVMVFPDGVKRAGIFEDNVFKESLKRAEQIDPFREELKEDCLQMLEELLAHRQQSKANLFGPLNKSKADLEQKEFNNQDLTIKEQSLLPRDASAERSSVKQSMGLLNVASDVISDNASVINQPMRDVDKEDLNLTMQKGIPMLNSVGSIQRSPHGGGLPPMPGTAIPQHYGRTIEVQTDLSMVTMEQYSQGNSKTFMNKTHDFKTQDGGGGAQSNIDNMSQMSPSHIKFQNDLNLISPAATNFNQSLQNSRKDDLKNVLSKPQFADTKHQQEILGGDNPNEDTESEWNRNNSSMMVRKPNLLNGTQNSLGPLPNDKFQFLPVPDTAGNQAMMKPRKQRSIVQPNSRSVGRRQLSNEATLKVSRTQNSSISPYVSHPPRGERTIAHSIPRENKFSDRNLIANRQGQRHDRSLPAQPQNNNNGGGFGAGNFVVPGPQPEQQQHSKPRHQNGFSIGGSESRKPPAQKMFQSQYGGSRFGGAAIHSNMRQNALPHPQSIFQNNQQPSQMQQQPYSMIDTPVQNRTYNIPNSEQQVYNRNGSGGPGLPNIFQGGGVHDTPQVHHGVQQRQQHNSRMPPSGVGLVAHNQPPNKFVHGGFNPQQQQNREDILTPSPKRTSNASQVQQFNNGHYENGDTYSQKMPQLSQNEMSIADQSGIAVEPMFGNEYGGQDGRDKYGKRVNSMEVESNMDEFRGMTSKSSQRTLRYNDFELVQKDAKDDPAFEVHLDEGDNKDSPRGGNDSVDTGDKSSHYPDMKMQKLYESNHGLPQSQKSPPFQKNVRSSASFLPKMGLNHSIDQHRRNERQGLDHSIEQQRRDERQRRHLNSNDTQLASHTINLNASQQGSPSMGGGNSHHHHVVGASNRIQRSLPPTHNQNSKISVKQGISLVDAGYVGGNRAGQIGVGGGGIRTQVSPKMQQHAKTRSMRPKRVDNNSGSRGRFDFVGPYAQNLKKPKLYEARGTQKIALKNHLASMNRQGVVGKLNSEPPFNSEVFPRKKSSLGGVDNYHDSQFVSLDAHGDKHSGRFNSGDGRGDAYTGNFVIQHQQLKDNLPQMSSLPQMSHEHNQVGKNKRVWVPYNKKLKLKGMQQTMAHGPGVNAGGLRSNGSGNPLLNSN